MGAAFERSPAEVARDADIAAGLFDLAHTETGRLVEGGPLESTLTYAGFELPEELWSAPKQLEFDPELYWCGKPR